ncbi:MAG: pyridoxal phosphate-dependent aminotransferase [Clostridia bacterium]|nr:pyridoxal phosphate-dependent aminotransferase [Clostridia bacterium]
MYNEKMYKLGSNRSVIRELFEFGKGLAEKVGPENVFDFSLGNPSVEPPKKLNQSIIDIINTSTPSQAHGYTSAPGDVTVRKVISKQFKDNFKFDISENNIFLTCGAAASLTSTFLALSEENDEFIVFAPFFPEYKVFIENAGAKCAIVSPNKKMGIDFDDLNKKFSKNVKGVVINYPNNPSGKIISDEQLNTLCAFLTKKQQEYNKEIFLISDEPYREICYGNKKAPFVFDKYDNSIICYSYSKSLSIPGERIGYIAVNPHAKESENVYLAICGAVRSQGYVCAPSLFQKVIKECYNLTSNIDEYKANRDLLYNSLTKYGYKAIEPDGAFYLFVKALEDDANTFSLKARKLGLLLVPSDSFGVKGYVRIAYCVSNDMIQRSLPKFKELIDNYDKY